MLTQKKHYQFDADNAFFIPKNHKIKYWIDMPLN